MVRYAGTDWTEQEDRQLRSQWKEGRSGSEIAKSVGRTRSAVLGRLSRLGLIGERKARGVPKAKPVTGRRPLTQNSGATRQRAPTIAPGFRGPRHWPAPSTAITVPQLQSHHCRWPVGEATGADQLFCGADADGGPWCAEHRAAGYGSTPIDDEAA